MLTSSSQAPVLSALAARASAAGLADASVLALASLAVISLGHFAGGFYPVAWGWGSLAAFVVAGSSIAVARRLDLTVRQVLMLAVGLALLAWTAASAMRPAAATRAIPELERLGFYLLVLWAALLVVRRASVTACVAGLWTGTAVVSSVGLTTHLFPGSAEPNAFEGRLLAQPLGYANAMGILAAMGAIIALGLATEGRSIATRTLAAASLVPLVTTVAFTGSRGADAAFVVGLAASVVLSPSRRVAGATALVTLPLPLIGAWAGSRTHIADPQATAALVTHDGRVVALLLVVLTATLATVARVVLRDDGIARRTGALTRIAPWALAFGVALPVLLAATADDVLGDRASYWHATLADFRANPLLGSGAGSFAAAWLQYRTIPVATQNAHNLYLETLAELGPVGLALLVAMLALPLTAIGAARRRHSLAVPAVGAYVAFLAHAAVDWDWQMPAVTVVALSCAVVVLAAARDADRREPRARPAALAAAIVVSASLALAAGFGLAGNTALARATAAANDGSWQAAERAARTAARWQPWSARPLLLLGEARLALGDRPAARASFSRAVRLDSRDWLGWYELGRTTPSARADAIRRIVRLNPMAVRHVAGGTASAR